LTAEPVQIWHGDFGIVTTWQNDGQFINHAKKPNELKLHVTNEHAHNAGCCNIELSAQEKCSLLGMQAPACEK